MFSTRLGTCTRFSQSVRRKPSLAPSLERTYRPTRDLMNRITVQVAVFALPAGGCAIALLTIMLLKNKAAC
ncbi:hypothetical protein WKK05_14375 [Nostoc sp. UHCC 0302]